MLDSTKVLVELCNKKDRELSEWRYVANYLIGRCASHMEEMNGDELLAEAQLSYRQSPIGPDPEPDPDNEKAHRDWTTRQGEPDVT